MKAIIPVAGLGTRMLPATKAIPKEMLPIVDKPLIQYVVNEAIAAGVKQIVLVTHSSKNSIENHFDTSFELEATLEARVKRQLLDEVRAICPPDVTILHIRQGVAKGLGHAIACARPCVGNNPFIVMLPDVLIDDAAANLKKDNLAEMVNNFRATSKSQVMVEAVPDSQVNKYGIVDCAGKPLNAGDAVEMVGMVEKPALEDAPSNQAVVGRYVLSRAIWDILDNTPVGAGGEVQLTDAIAELMKQETVEAYSMIGKSHDCGSKVGYMLANMEYGLRHPEVKDAMSDFMLQQTSAAEVTA
ncbi:UTP--glucose-1-phosphate uridylyltransferase [Oleispira antarctica]|uniref:UTP--glucose-1-phosphate uridylyltransferase n=1 Tax=Oleispira antarctica TaxID=188908 RepID=A0A1Y5HY22_OLEAN|nr:UTP--glucose-1-phosphate uridylyltransferase [Oleispira antarctica]